MTAVSPEAEALAAWRCSDRMNRFFWYRDHGQGNEAADLFAEDGTWTSGAGIRSAGRAQVAAAVAKAAATLGVRHVVSNVIDEPGADATTRAARAYYVVYSADPHRLDTTDFAALDPVWVGECTATFRHVGGDWQIATITMNRVFGRGLLSAVSEGNKP